MVTKILNLLENPLLSDSFRQAIKEGLEGILNKFPTDLSTQKNLLDELVLVINNHIRIEENIRVLEAKLVQLVETERALAVAKQEMKEAAIQLEEKKRELESLSLEVIVEKEVVEA